MGLQILPGHVVEALGGRESVMAAADDSMASIRSTSASAVVIEGTGPFRVWLSRELAGRAAPMKAGGRPVPHVSRTRFPTFDRTYCLARARGDLEPLGANAWASDLYFLKDIDTPGPFNIWLTGERADSRFIEETILGRRTWKTSSSTSLELVIALHRRARRGSIEELEKTVLAADAPESVRLVAERRDVSELTEVVWKHPELEQLERDEAEFEADLGAARKAHRVESLAGEGAEFGVKRKKLFESDDHGALEVRKLVDPREGLVLRLSWCGEMEEALWALTGAVAMHSETKSAVSLFMVSA